MQLNSRSFFLIQLIALVAVILMFAPGASAASKFTVFGNLYGTASYDGAFGFGTVFKLTPRSHGWTETLLYNFRGSSSQRAINSGVVFDAAGNLYGAAYPENACCSLIYQLTPQRPGRWKYRTVHHFTGSQQGGEPNGNLILDSQGNLYGTAAIRTLQPCKTVSKRVRK
jgi:uncharacterized repeat protein (TIGR03803 family)